MKCQECKTDLQLIQISSHPVQFHYNIGDNLWAADVHICPLFVIPFSFLVIPAKAGIHVIFGPIAFAYEPTAPRKLGIFDKLWGTCNDGKMDVQ